MESSPSCVNHPERPARWFCWSCGKALCEECVTLRSGQYYCEDCLEENINESSQLELEADGPRWPDINYEANLVKRLFAFEIDFVILVVICGLLSSLLGIIFQLNVVVSQKLFMSLFYLGLLLRDGVFPAGSPGKSFLNLYVWNNSKNRPANLWDSFLRNLFFPVFFFDLLTIPFSSDRQRAGDILAGTVVYDEKFRIEEDKFIYRAAGLTSLLLAGLLVIFVSWFAAEVRHRAPDFSIIEAGDSEAGSIKGILEQVAGSPRSFQVQENNSGLQVDGEYPDAESYYQARSRITGTLEKRNYEVVEVEPPEMVLRGPDEKYFKLVIKARK